MSERKVLNKYYPADYDPSKIPRAKRPKNRQWTIRTMAPFNMRCNTCGEYIYKGKKFNSRQELAEGETYLGLKVFRFYIKCPRCVSEISFKTDPENVDYAMEAGATRNFEALRTAEQMAEREAKEKEEELANNPMKMLENRTKASQREMDMLETLQDLKDMNKKHATVDTENIIEQYKLYEEKLQQLQDEEDEALVKSVFGKDETIKRIADSDEDSDTSEPIVKKSKLEAATDILVEKPVASCSSSSKCPSTSINAPKKAQNIVTKKSSLLQSKPLLKTLVKTKAKSSGNTEEETKAPLKDNDKETKAKSNDDEKPLIVGGLSLLGGYSGSSDSD